MKVSREQAEENRERVIDVASKLFRERGFHGIGVADLMKEAGLTHGGFYGQFKSKEDLIAQAVARSLSRSARRWTQVIDEAKDDPVEAFIEFYLSPRHRDHVSGGCLFAALGPEISREDAAVRRSVTEGLQPHIELLTRILPGRSKAERRRKALSAYASLIGAMVLARAVDDPELSEEVFRAVAFSIPKTKTRKPRKTRATQHPEPVQ